MKRPQHHRITTFAAAVFAAALLTACDDAGTSPDAIDDAELLILADQAMADAENDIGYVRAPGIRGLRFPGRIPGLGDGDTPDCPQENGTYVCTIDGRFGALTTEVTFFDEGGAIQDAYDEALTASVHIASNMEGGPNSERFTGSISRSRDVTVTGLLGEETTRVWNGTSTGSSTRTHQQGEFAGESISTTSTSTIENLTLPLPEDDGDRGYPLAGTVTTDLTATGGPRAGDHRIVVTFDGTQFATVTIDGETMTVDLEERRRGRRHGMHSGN